MSYFSKNLIVRIGRNFNTMGNDFLFHSQFLFPQHTTHFNAVSYQSYHCLSSYLRHAMKSGKIVRSKKSPVSFRVRNSQPPLKFRNFRTSSSRILYFCPHFLLSSIIFYCKLRFNRPVTVRTIQMMTQSVPRGEKHRRVGRSNFHCELQSNLP